MTDTSGIMGHRFALAGLGTLLLVTIGLLLYTPWEPVPFDITDFSELLPVLGTSDSFVESVGSTVDYYASHGRSNVVTSTFIATNWSLFGQDPVAWRVFRTAVLGTAIFFTLLFLSRFGIGASGAILGSSLLVMTPVAAANWLRLTGEPLALLSLLGLLTLCLRFRTTERWRLTAAGIWALTVLLVLTKEVMIVTLPLALIVTLTWEDGRGFGKPRLERRQRFLLAGWVPAVALVLIVVGLVAAGADPTGYARGYGSAPMGLPHFLMNLVLISLPLTGQGLMLSVTNIVFILIVALGWILKFNDASLGARSVGARLAAIISLPVAGAVIYLPWRRFEDFYALPFQLGVIMLLAVAVDHLQDRLPRRRWLIGTMVGAVLLAPALLVYRTARHTAALRHVNRSLVSAVTRYPTADSLFVAVGGLPEQAWQGRAATIARFSTAIGEGENGVLEPADKTCSEAASLLEQSTYPMVMISYSHMCGTFPRPTEVFRRSYSYIALPSLATQRDTVKAEILVR